MLPLLPTASGVYTLLVRLPAGPVPIGSLGLCPLTGGYYGYVGSALAGLRRRLLRHLTPPRRPWWHIDHLLAVGNLYAIVWAETSQRQECQLAGQLAGCMPWLKGFGSSDCRCPSHLFFAATADELEGHVQAAFAQAGLKATTLRLSPSPPQDRLGQPTGKSRYPPLCDFKHRNS